MIAKKKILKLDDEFLEPEELLFLITSTNKDYRMAYFLNKQLSFNFIRRPDLEYSHHDHDATGSYAVYSSEQESLGIGWYLLGNKHAEGNLLKKTTNVDYLLVAKGNYQVVDTAGLIAKLRKVPNTLFVQQSQYENLPNIADVLELLELMIMREDKKEKAKITEQKKRLK